MCVPSQKVSEYDQESPKSHIVDQPTAPKGRDTEYQLAIIHQEDN